MYLNNYNRYLKIHNLDNIINEENIYIGGPCEDKNIYGLIYINNLDDFNVTLKNVKIIKKFENKYVIFGDYIYIYKLYHVKPENVIHLHVYCGYAGWSYTQLLKPQGDHSTKTRREPCSTTRLVTYTITKTHDANLAEQQDWSSGLSRGTQPNAIDQLLASSSLEALLDASSSRAACFRRSSQRSLSR